MSVKSKKDLEQENSLLRNKLKELIDRLSTNNSNPDLTELGMGVTRIDGKFKLVKIAYNPLTFEAKVTEVADASHLPEAVHMAEYKAKECLSSIISAAIERK